MCKSFKHKGTISWQTARDWNKISIKQNSAHKLPQALKKAHVTGKAS